MSDFAADRLLALMDAARGPGVLARVAARTPPAGWTLTLLEGPVAALRPPSGLLDHLVILARAERASEGAQRSLLAVWRAGGLMDERPTRHQVLAAEGAVEEAAGILKEWVDASWPPRYVEGGTNIGESP